MSRQFILIMTDTTRKDMLGCYGNPDMKTPNLDRLASEGIRYENAYSCQPVCGPARSAIFTGTFPHTNGMVTNCVALRSDARTIGERLTGAGVHSTYIGKWHLDGWDYFGRGVCPDGWDRDYWYDMRCYLEELSDEERKKSRKKETSFNSDMNEKFTYAHRCSNRAVDFLKRFRGEDFFLTVSYDEPHGPYLCPKPFCTMYENYSMKDNPAFHDDLKSKPLMQRLWAGKALHEPDAELNRPSERLALFLGCNSFVDYEIGRVLDAARECAPDACILYTSDHGAMLGSHRLEMKNATVYKEVDNIPFIIKGGEKGKVETAPASHIDIAPTVLEYFGVPVPPAMEGKSMLKQIQDASVKVNDVVYSEFTRYEVDHDGFGGLQMMRAVISERYKLAVHLLDTDEFYDMQEDPYEIHNLIDSPEYADRRDHLHDLLLEHMNTTRDLYRGYQWAARPWRKDKVPAWENDGCTRQKESEEGEPRQLDYDTGLPMNGSVRKKKKP
jgi:arylsulfatase A-like enzyme